MTLSAISTDNLALAAGLPFEIRPDTAQFAVLVAQEPGGGFAPVQSSGGTIATSGTGGGGGGGSNAAASTIGAAAPNSGDYLAFSNGGGTLVGVSPSNPLPVGGTLTLSAGTTLAVTGTFWQTTQPISAASLPLPSGAATAAGLTTLNTTMGSPFQAGGSIGNTAFGATQSGAWTVGLSAGQTITLAGSNTVTLAAGSANAGTFNLASSTFTLAAGASNIGTVAFAASSSVTLAAGASNIGTIAGSSANIPTYLQAVSSGGYGNFRAINAAGSNMATNIKASGGNIGAVDVSNGTTATIYVRLFNLAVAPTVGTSTPSYGPIAIPAGTTWQFRHDVGLYFATGISFDVTTGSMADADTSSIATANQVAVSFAYK